ncbi:MAG TPA: hypothetical protein VJQ84_09230 [Solirubrobacterales bacterium]|nr:hypothetical protein [Solirubrobacterales bacterium]
MTQPDGHSQPRSNLGSRLLLALQALIALALLAIAMAPLAAPVVSPESAQADVDFIAEETDEEGEEEEWELEEGEEESEEEEFGSKGATLLPPECLLRSAEPSVVAQLDSGTLRLTLHYTSRASTPIKLDYWLKGGKGSLQLGSATRHLGRQGALHLTSHLDEREAAKVRAARTFIVELDLPAAPSSCAKYLTMRLNARDLDRSRATWSERTGS